MSQLILVKRSELLVLANDADTDIMLGEFCVLGTSFHCLNTMLDKIFPAKRGEVLVVSFEVGLGTLASISNGHSMVLVVVGRGASLEEVGASLVDGSDEKADAEWSFGWVASLHLTLLGNLTDKSLSRLIGLMGIRVINALITHELAKETSISSHTRDGDTHVLIDLENLLLMECQIVLTLFQTDKYNMSVGLKSETGETLLNSFFSVVNLKNFSLRVKGSAILAVIS
mmetsp:Transcript_9776/g.13241  ORF Transcript_9776/g.13241 Transcript_9776/m.13241 type:complete len:228 (-) Transcript_9776:12-695(-)